jgi:hypothetical protein
VYVYNPDRELFVPSDSPLDADHRGFVAQIQCLGGGRRYCGKPQSENEQPTLSPEASGCVIVPSIEHVHVGVMVTSQETS